MLFDSNYVINQILSFIIIFFYIAYVSFNIFYSLILQKKKIILNKTLNENLNNFLNYCLKLQSGRHCDRLSINNLDSLSTTYKFSFHVKY